MTQPAQVRPRDAGSWILAITDRPLSGVGRPRHRSVS